MGRSKNKPDDQRPGVPGLKAKVSLGDDVIGTGKIRLLELLGETGSISGAAREMGMGYRRAWTLLESLQRCFDEPLFETSRGGGNQGGTTLTPFGLTLVDRHRRFEATLGSAAKGYLDWLRDAGGQGAQGGGSETDRPD